MKTRLVTGIALGIFLILVINILSISYFTQKQDALQNNNNNQLQAIGINKNETISTASTTPTKNTTQITQTTVVNSNARRPAPVVTRAS